MEEKKRGRPPGKTKGIDELAEEFGVPTRDEVELMQFIDEMGPSTTIIDVFRKRLDGGRGHVGRVEPNVLFEDPYTFLRESFGPGTYILGFKNSARSYLAWKTLHVEGPSAVAVVPVKSGPDDHVTFMREQSQMQQNLITSLIASMKPMDLTPLVQMFAGNRGPDPAQMLTAVVAAFSALRGPQQDEDWLKRAKTIIEIAKDLQPDNGGSGGPENVWSVVRDVGKEVLLRLNPAVGDPPPGAALRGPAAPVHIPPVKVADGGQEVNQRERIEGYVKVAIAYLKTKAQAEKEPELFIDFILGNEEEPQWSALCYAIQNGATFENLLEFDAEIRDNPAYQSWFKTVYDGLHSNIFESLDTGGAGGNAGDASAHEKVSEAGRGKPGSKSTGG